jgi:hypothetical protein
VLGTGACTYIEPDGTLAGAGPRRLVEIVEDGEPATPVQLPPRLVACAEFRGPQTSTTSQERERTMRKAWRRAYKSPPP